MRSVKSARTFPMLKNNEQETAEKEDELPLLVPEEEDYQIPDSFGDGYDLHFQELEDGEYPNHFPLSNAFRTTLPNYNNHSKAISALTVLYPNKRRYDHPVLATGSDDHSVRLWDIWNNFHILTIPCEDKVTSLAAYNKYGSTKLVICMGGDKAPTVTIWDYATQDTKSLSFQLALYHERPIITSSIIDSNSNAENSPPFLTPVLLLGSIDRVITLWNMKHHSLIYKFVPESIDMLVSVSVYDRGLGSENIELITTTADKTILFWKNESTIPYCKLLTPHGKNITATCFHVLREKNHENKISEIYPILITASLDKNIYLWDVETKEKIKKLEGHMDKITSISVYDRKESVITPLLITGSEDMKVILWNLLTGEKQRIFSLNEKIYCVQLIITDYGLLISAGSNIGKTHLINLCKTEKIKKFSFENPVTTISVYKPRILDNFVINGESIVNPVALVGSTNSTISLYDFQHQEPYKVFDKHDGKIYAMTIYTPPSKSSGMSLSTPTSDSNSTSFPNHPLVISADSKAVIKVWDLFTFKLIKELKRHAGAVFSVDIYDPAKCGKTVYTMTTTSKKRRHVLDMTKPMILSAGSDGHVMFWDLLSPNANDSFIDKLDKAHNHFIRSIIVHNPVNINDDPLFLTGSFDRTVNIWNLYTREKIITLKNVHTDYIYCMALYDPFEHLGEKLTIQNKTITTIPNDVIKDRIRKGIHSDFLRFPSLITGSYDSTLAVWDLRKGKLRHHLKDYHYDSITAVALHVPASKSENPFVISGSMDHLICIWDIFTGKLIHRLVGHQERINCFATLIPNPIDSQIHLSATYGSTKSSRIPPSNGSPILNTKSSIELIDPVLQQSGTSFNVTMTTNNNEMVPENSTTESSFSPSHRQSSRKKNNNNSPSKSHRNDLLPQHEQKPLTIPLLFSGSDDQTMIIWEDCIYYKSFLPLKDEINRCFDYDRSKKDWPMISYYVKKYDTKFFYENSHLFFLSVRYNRPDFLLKFRKYLTLTIAYMKKSHHGTMNLLHYALLQSDLISFRIILLSWVEALNTDILDLLYQKLFHAIHYFDDANLLLIAKKYPVEFKHFILSLKLIRNHPSLLKNQNEHIHKVKYSVYYRNSGNSGNQNNTNNDGANQNNSENNSRNVLSPQGSFRNSFFSALSGGLRGSKVHRLSNTNKNDHDTHQDHANNINNNDEDDEELMIVNYNAGHEVIDNNSYNPIRLMKLNPSSRYEVNGSFFRSPKFNEVWNYQNSYKKNKHGLARSTLHPRSSSINDGHETFSNSLRGADTGGTRRMGSLTNLLQPRGSGRGGLGGGTTYRATTTGVAGRRSSFTRMRSITNVIAKSTFQDYHDYYYESYTYWSRLWHNFFLDSSDPQPVTTLLVPLKNTAKLKESLELFVKVSNQLDSVDIFNSEVSIVSFRYFWNAHAKFYHIRALFRYFLLLTLFTFTLIIYQFFPHPNQGHQPDIKVEKEAYEERSEIGLQILNVIVLLFFLYYCYEEFSQIRYYNINSLRAFILHFTDIWNFLDVMIISTGITGLILRVIYNYESVAGRCILALTSIVMWFKVLYFMRPFSNSGPLVTMLIQIAYSIRFFIVVLICVLVGFTLGFWVLSNIEEELTFSKLDTAFMTMFAYMIGQEVDRDFTGTASPSMMTFLVVMFMMTMTVLMMNLLIALMGDTFAKVRSKGLAIWRKEQASIIIEESFLFSSAVQKQIPPFLHVLKYTTDVGSYDTSNSSSSAAMIEENNNTNEDSHDNDTNNSGNIGRNILLKLINQNKIHMIPFTDLYIDETTLEYDSDDDNNDNSNSKKHHSSSSHYEDFYEYYRQSMQGVDDGELIEENDDDDDEDSDLSNTDSEAGGEKINVGDAMMEGGGEDGHKGGGGGGGRHRLGSADTEEDEDEEGDDEEEKKDGFGPDVHGHVRDFDEGSIVSRRSSQNRRRATTQRRSSIF